MEGNPKYLEVSSSGLPFTNDSGKLSSRCRFFVFSCSVGDVKYNIPDQYIINKNTFNHIYYMFAFGKRLNIPTIPTPFRTSFGIEFELPNRIFRSGYSVSDSNE